jgi:hypothetical protein
VYSQNLNVLSSSAPQAQLSYDASNHLQVRVSSAGAVTYNATGASAGHSFSDPVTVVGALTADALVVGATEKLHYDGSTAGNTYTHESAADVLDTYAGGTIYLRISGGNGIYYFNQPTTASAANAFLDSGTGLISRSTSSLRYKDVTGELSLDEAWRLVDGARAISYTPKGGGREHVGLAAEWIHKIDPRFTTVDGEGRPDWVQYPHLTAPLMLALADVKRRLQAAGLWH